MIINGDMCIRETNALTLSRLKPPQVSINIGSIGMQMMSIRLENVVCVDSTINFSASTTEIASNINLNYDWQLVFGSTNIKSDINSENYTHEFSQVVPYSTTLTAEYDPNVIDDCKSHTP